MTKINQLHVGQRVRLIQDLPEPSQRRPSFNLYRGDEGIVESAINGLIGFKSDRFVDVISITRYVDGKMRRVLDYCEPINSQLAETQKLPDFIEIGESE